MDFDLTPAQQRIQAQARAFAEQEVAPVAREADEKGEFPLHLVERMGELGFLAGPIDPVYGGSGMDYVSYALLCEELGRADSSVRGFLTVHASLVSLCIQDWGSEEQKRRYLPRLARGEWIGCYALTEPDAGSDAASMETTAREEGDFYILNGEKIWITNGMSAKVAIVFATMDRALKHKGICAFIVETDTPGFEREPMPGKELGHRASEHVHITLRDCRAPKGALLGKPGEGFKIAMSALDRGRLGVAAGALGASPFPRFPFLGFPDGSPSRGGASRGGGGRTGLGALFCATYRGALPGRDGQGDVTAAPRTTQRPHGTESRARPGRPRDTLGPPGSASPSPRPGGQTGD